MPFVSVFVSVALCASAPRGLAAGTEVELVTLVDSNLAKWLPGGAAVKPLLANEKELEAMVRGLVATSDSRSDDPEAVVKKVLKGSMEEQKLVADRKTFTAVRALVSVRVYTSSVDLFDAEGLHCFVELVRLESGRLVLQLAPLTDERPFKVVSGNRERASLKYFEKRSGVWTQAEIPKPPLPDCTAKLITAAKAVFVSEKAYLAERDVYSTALDQLGVDERELGAKVKITSAGATGFTAEVSAKDGVVRITDSGQPEVLKRCTQ